MKVWSIPVRFPNPEEKPEQAQAATRFIQTLKGLHGITPHESGMVLLSFQDKADARAAKWKLEEFSTAKVDMIEGTVSDDGKTLNLNRVLKEE